MASTTLFFRPTCGTSHVRSSSISSQPKSTLLGFNNTHDLFLKSNKFSSLKLQVDTGRIPAKASPEDKEIVGSEGEGISLGTMELPANTDFERFESLLFQWANSLCQGANIPLPMPLKVDKVKGGVRLAFIDIDDGKTEVLVYIDCLVFPATDDSGPIFRALRNGSLKDRAPPGEPRIMRSLLQALKKSVEIARI